MSAKSALLGSSLVKKYWMALTGLFLCSFLVVHLIGNLQLLYSDGGLAFNEYAEFMTTFPLIKVTSYLLYFSILFHAVDGIMLVMQNKKARPVSYAYNKPGANSVWTSRYMGILGTIILVFIVTHMAQFWGKMHFDTIPVMQVEGEYLLASGEALAGAVAQNVDGTMHLFVDGKDMGKGLKDLYTVVVKTYTEGAMGHVWVILYVLAMAALAFHLSHGFASAFQSLGLRHPRYTKLIKIVGLIFSYGIAAAFAAIPVLLHICNHA